MRWLGLLTLAGLVACDPAVIEDEAGEPQALPPIRLAGPGEGAVSLAGLDIGGTVGVSIEAAEVVAFPRDGS